MSLPNTNVCCTDCTKVSIWRTGQVHTVTYQLPHGRTYQARAHKGWCYDCDNLRPIEPVFDRQALMSEIKVLAPTIQGSSYKALSFVSAIVRQKPYKEDTLVELESLVAALEVATLRSSSARHCLNCGSENTVPFADGLTHACGGKLYIAPDDTDAPRFSYAPLTTHVDFDGQKADLPDSLAWASHLAKRSIIESVLAKGIFSGFLVRIPLPRGDLNKLAQAPEWVSKFCKIIELRIMHSDFDGPVEADIDANPALKQSVSEAHRVALSSDTQPVAKWLRSQVRSE